jgi:hypothetical protein
VLMSDLIWIYLPFCKHEYLVQHSDLLLHPKPISSTNLLELSMTCPFHILVDLVEGAGDSGGPKTPG